MTRYVGQVVVLAHCPKHAPAVSNKDRRQTKYIEENMDLLLWALEDGLCRSIWMLAPEVGLETGALNRGVGAVGTPK